MTPQPARGRRQETAAERERLLREALEGWAKDACVWCSIGYGYETPDMHWIKGPHGGTVLQCEVPSSVRALLQRTATEKEA